MNIKKVLIIGAHGKVGQIITQKLVNADEFEPLAMFRKENQRTVFDNIGAQSVVASLESGINSLADIMKDIDAVVFSAGSGGKTGDDKTLEIDLDGAVKAMDAAIQANVKRFVIVSAIGTDNRAVWESSGIMTYYIAKHYADRILKTTDLDYTILRPGLLLDIPGSGKINLKNPIDEKGVSREDVANMVLEVLRNENSIRKTIEFNNGDVPIEQAI